VSQETELPLAGGDLRQVNLSDGQWGDAAVVGDEQGNGEFARALAPDIALDDGRLVELTVHALDPLADGLRIGGRDDGGGVHAPAVALQQGLDDDMTLPGPPCIHRAVITRPQH